MEKPKILFVTWSLTQGGGEAQSVINILNNVDLNKYEIDVFELNHGIKEISVKKELNFINPIVDYTDTNQTQKQKRILTYYMRHPEEIEELFNDEYDCVIACNRGSTSTISAFIPSKSRIVWIRGSIENLNQNIQLSVSEKELIKYRYDEQNKIFKYYDKIVAVSDSVELSLIKLFPEEKEKVVKIYNSIDPNTVKKLANEEIDTYIPVKENIIVNMGRLKEVKNQKLLIDAMKILVNKRKDVELIIIGEGPLHDELTRKIKEYNLEDYVKLIGFMKNPFNILKKAKIFCLSSLSEGFCLSISEACNLNVPFVSTKVGGAEELVKETNCGFIVDSDAKQFAEKIDALLTDKNLYDEMKKNTIIASQRFDTKKLAIEVEKLIDDLLENRTGGD
jgi:glycosyltransferase involved in cell wall biosynthesis